MKYNLKNQFIFWAIVSMLLSCVYTFIGTADLNNINLVTSQNLAIFAVILGGVSIFFPKKRKYRSVNKKIHWKID